MQHSIKEIAERYSELSDMREDAQRFKKEDFIQFAKDNKKKYSLVDNGDDMLVSTWYSGDLIEAYRNTL